MLDTGIETLEKKANHRANVVRVGAITPHPNADKLELTTIGGYQVVIGKGTMHEGDLAIYIQPDSIVPQTEPFKFLWQDHVGIDGTVPERRRRVTVRRFRKEWSEGLLLPIEDFGFALDLNGKYLGLAYNDTVEGQDVSGLIGVTHYIPEADRESVAGNQVPLKDRPHRRYPKTLRGWFYFLLWKLGVKSAQKDYALDVAFNYPIYDVDAYKNYRGAFRQGEEVVVSEKIHGSNARYVFVDGVFYAGSRQQWKQKGGNVWWNVANAFPVIEEWCTQNPGKVLYGEVGPTQKGFRYGADDGEVWFYAFDVYDPKTQTWEWPGNIGVPSGITAPVIAVVPFSEDLLALADGQSVIPRAQHIREGVVISSRERRGKLKVVSNAFLEKDSK